MKTDSRSRYRAQLRHTRNAHVQLQPFTSILDVAVEPGPLVEKPNHCMSGIQWCQLPIYFSSTPMGVTTNRHSSIKTWCACSTLQTQVSINFQDQARPLCFHFHPLVTSSTRLFQSRNLLKEWFSCRKEHSLYNERQGHDAERGCAVIKVPVLFVGLHHNSLASQVTHERTTLQLRVLLQILCTHH